MTKKNDLRLKGKTAIVTGSVRRIGRSIALALAEEGANVVIHAKESLEEAQETVLEAKRIGGQAIAHLADITDEKEVQKMVDRTIEHFGRLDILVNNAAIRRQVPFLEMTLKEWRTITNIILDGAFICAHAALPHMLKNAEGRIVNIGGITSFTGAFDRAHVASAKAGLIGLTKSLAIEFGTKGITANCVVPGLIGGERSQTSQEMSPKPGGRETLVGRNGTSEEVAAMVLALCLPTGAFITGQTIHINGGRFMP
jgi:3-oxoacyl-[acyl-carrier protein] reductase